MLPDWLLILHLKVNLDQDYHWKVNIVIYATTYSMYWFGLQMNVGFGTYFSEHFVHLSLILPLDFRVTRGQYTYLAVPS